MERFLALHTDHLIASWQWVFAGTMLRATTDTGLTATVSRAEADELVRDGRMRWGVNQAYLEPITKRECEAA